MSPNNDKYKFTIFGQDPDILQAMLANILSWCVRAFVPSLLPKLLPTCSEEDIELNEDVDADVLLPIPAPESESESESEAKASSKRLQSRTKCISIGRPGGMEQLRVIQLKEGIMTVGYNVKHYCEPPFTPCTSKIAGSGSEIPSDCVVLSNECFSVNYADCTIRWGLYESAKQFVGWPIVPGFDIAGTVEYVGTGASSSLAADAADTDSQSQSFQVGDRVFGCTLFGAYSTKVLVPSIQLRKIPKGITMEQAASLPAVALTALHALSLAGYFPLPSVDIDTDTDTDTAAHKSTCTGGHSYSNRSILIHSAAGGVGGMLVQMSKILGLGPIVGVVGTTSKVQAAKALGCDVVIDKSCQDLWELAQEVVTNAGLSGYKTIMDANGVSTLQNSYNHLAATGRLVIFGFHSNLPMGRDMLSPFEWIRMARKMGSMPAFDPMDLVVDNKSVLGFNLSFFADEKEVVSSLFDQICVWLEDGKLKCPIVSIFDSMDEIGKAHALIQSGRSIGKIVVRC